MAMAAMPAAVATRRRFRRSQPTHPGCLPVELTEQDAQELTDARGQMGRHAVYPRSLGSGSRWMSPLSPGECAAAGAGLWINCGRRVAGLRWPLFGPREERTDGIAEHRYRPTSQDAPHS